MLNSLNELITSGKTAAPRVRFQRALLLSVEKKKPDECFTRQCRSI